MVSGRHRNRALGERGNDFSDRDRAREGADAAFERLYDELHLLAHRQLARLPGTMQTTGLVHEAYLKLIRVDGDRMERAHFLNLASRAMRQILVDAAKRRSADKRGGGIVIQSLTGEPGIASPEPAIGVLELDRVLARLEEVDERSARLVELHFFGGLDFSEVADTLGVSRRTAMRDWRAARALLHAELSGSP